MFEEKIGLPGAIKQSQNRSFKNLGNEADVNLSATVYRVVMSELKGKKSPQVTCLTMLALTVKILSPQRSNTVNEAIGAAGLEAIPRLTENELFQVYKKMKDRKAPAPDGISNKALKVALYVRPDMFIQAM